LIKLDKNIEDKICNKCMLLKPINCFGIKLDTKDGYRNICKSCKNTENKIYRENNEEKIKNYYKINKIKHNEICKNYVKNNKDKVNIIKKKYRDDNKDKVKISQKNWRDKNKHMIAWRNTLNNSLKRLGKSKEGKTIELLGYSALDLKNHLECLFTDGMSWDNYGKWHIDHKKALILFDVDTPINIVNELSNLQPLWCTTREINGIIYQGNLNKNKFLI
jgi:hypothetical protein